MQQKPSEVGVATADFDIFCGLRCFLVGLFVRFFRITQKITKQISKKLDGRMIHGPGCNSGMFFLLSFSFEILDGS